MTLPSFIIAKEQNFSVICKGNDKIYHSSSHEYDYLKNALDISTGILKKAMKDSQFKGQHAVCFKLLTKVYFIAYIEKGRPNNPYFAVFRQDTQSYSQTESIEIFQIFKEKDAIDLLKLRIEGCIFCDQMLFPNLLDEMSKIADEYDKELDYHTLGE